MDEGRNFPFPPPGQMRQFPPELGRHRSSVASIPATAKTTRNLDVPSRCSTMFTYVNRRRVAKLAAAMGPRVLNVRPLCPPAPVIEMNSYSVPCVRIFIVRLFFSSVLLSGSSLTGPALLISMQISSCTQHTRTVGRQKTLMRRTMRGSLLHRIYRRSCEEKRREPQKYGARIRSRPPKRLTAKNGKKIRFFFFSIYLKRSYSVAQLNFPRSN